MGGSRDGETRQRRSDGLNAALRERHDRDENGHAATPHTPYRLLFWYRSPWIFTRTNGPSTRCSTSRPYRCGFRQAFHHDSHAQYSLTSTITIEPLTTPSPTPH